MEGLLAIALTWLIVWIVVRVVRYILKERYFASEGFLAHKAEIASFVAEHNEVAKYIAEIRSRGSFQLAHRPPAPRHIWRRSRTPAIGTTAGTGT